MKISNIAVAVAIATVSHVSAFTTPTTPSSSVSTTTLLAEKSSDDKKSTSHPKIINTNPFVKFFGTAVMTATLWGSPALLAEQALNSQQHHHHLPPIISAGPC